jgi:diguanylate cyclase (GGDEF)-like protein
MPFGNRPAPPEAAGSGETGRTNAQHLAGVVTLLAAIAAMAIALAIPSIYFASVRTRIAGAVEARAQVYADEVSNSTEQNPALWNALLDGSDIDPAGLSVATPDLAEADTSPPEQRRVLARGGRQIIFVPPQQPLDWPLVSARAPVMQNGHRLGEVEITRSLRPMLALLLPVTIASLVFGLLLLTVLRLIPLRLLRQALDRAHYVSAHDLLTGLPNRRLFADRLEQALAVARRTGGSIAMLCLDLDHFKEVNDTLGHAAGDELLRTMAARWQRCLRESETLARLGGDEFAVITHALHKPEDAAILAARLIETVREPIPLDGQLVFVGLSIGIAVGAPGALAAELAQQADVALYQAKASGRGGHCFFAPEMEVRLRQRRALENDLRQALETGKIALHYQPQIDVASGEIVGAEAMMRWLRPNLEPVPPSIFIAVAEETGLIRTLGAWALNEACREASYWPDRMRLAVNVSPMQFRHVGFLDAVRQALDSSGLDPRRLELELTEDVTTNSSEDTMRILADLRCLGVRLAMDDFGTGHSSLGYLHKFKFDKLKIDRSFIMNLGEDPNAAAIVRAVVGLTEELGMSSNAEGVETIEQMEILRRYGCDEVQGYLFGAPMPPAALHDLIVTFAGRPVLPIVAVEATPDGFRTAPVQR